MVCIGRGIKHDPWGWFFGRTTAMRNKDSDELNSFSRPVVTNPLSEYKYAQFIQYVNNTCLIEHEEDYILFTILI